MSARRLAVVVGSDVHIPLTRGFVAVVDACDGDLGESNWCVSKGYAIRHVGPRGCIVTENMHRTIASRAGHAIDGLEVDHIDGDRLNNRRSNLRPATHSENGRNRPGQSNNRSGAKGVSWHKARGKWQVHIKTDGQKRYLGLFNTVAEAAEVYRVAAELQHGRFAKTA